MEGIHPPISPVSTSMIGHAYSHKSIDVLLIIFNDFIY